MIHAYSRHTFFFPFTWDKDEIDFSAVFDGGGPQNIWQPVVFSQVNNYLKTVSLNELKTSEYNAFHFFNENARSLLFSEPESIILNCYMINDEAKKDLKYIIIKNGIEYSLDVLDIVLYIYSTDTAIMEIKCINTTHHSLAAVKDINEYGCRLVQPFWSKTGFSKCADSLSFQGKNINIQDDFKSFSCDQVSFCYISKIIRGLLNQNGHSRVFRAKLTDKECEIQIRSMVDEKMFVCCLVCDRVMMESLMKSYNANEDVFSPETEANLAELVFVDTEGGCKNKNQNVIKRKLYESLYIDDFSGKDPKLMAVSDRAYIKLTALSDFDIEYFDDIYTKIILIGLLQRISIAEFSSIISIWTTKVSSNKIHISTEAIKNIMRLQEKFATFQNRYMLNEITVKNEGIFMYRHIRDCLHIADEFEDMSLQITSLYELVSTSQNNSFSKWGLTLALISIGLSLESLILTANDIAQLNILNFKGSFPLLIDVAIIVIIFWLIFGIIFKRKDK